MSTKKQEEIQKVIKLLNKNTYRYEIVKILSNKGYDAKEIEEIIEEATAIDKVKHDKIRKIIWISLTVITVLVFLFVIPNSVYNIAPFILSFVGGALFLFFIIQSVADFKSFEEFNKPIENEPKKLRFLPLYFIGSLALVLCFYLNFKNSEENELLKYGVKVKGTVIDGKAYTSRRGGTYDIKIRFLTRSGNLIVVNEDVGKSEFNDYYVGQKVDLIYSKKNPELIELLTTDENIKKYIQSEERPLNFNDLVKLFDVIDVEKEDYLNKIQAGWLKQDYQNFWINERKQTGIKKADSKNITLIYLKSVDGLHFEKEFKKNGLVKIKGTNFYESDKYIGELSTEVDSKSYSMTTVIQLAKKEN